MKIQLDTNLKTIKIDETVNLNELFEMLEKILPNGEWKEFKLETNTIINTWTNPIVINPWVVYPYHYEPIRPWYEVTCKNVGGVHGLNTYQLNTGVYNLELQK